MESEAEKKLQLLNEWQNLQTQLDSAKEQYTHTDEYAYMRKIRTLADYDIASPIHHSCAKLQDYLDGRIIYSSRELNLIAGYFTELAQLTACKETIEKNKHDWNIRIDEIKKELGVK